MKTDVKRKKKSPKQLPFSEELIAENAVSINEKLNDLVPMNICTNVRMEMYKNSLVAKCLVDSRNIRSLLGSVC